MFPEKKIVICLGVDILFHLLIPVIDLLSPFLLYKSNLWSWKSSLDLIGLLTELRKRTKNMNLYLIHFCPFLLTKELIWKGKKL